MIKVEEYIKSNRPKIVRWAYVRCKEQAEDIANDVCLKIWKVYKDEKEEEEWSKIFVTAIKNKHIDVVRSTKISKYDFEDIDILSLIPSDANPERKVMQSRCISKLKAAIMGMSNGPMAWDVFTGMSYNDAAEKYNTTINTIGCAIHRVRVKICQDYGHLNIGK